MGVSYDQVNVYRAIPAAEDLWCEHIDGRCLSESGTGPASDHEDPAIQPNRAESVSTLWRRWVPWLVSLKDGGQATACVSTARLRHALRWQ